MTESERNQIKRLWESGMPLTQIHRMTAMTSAEFKGAVEEMRQNGDFGSVRDNAEKKVVRAFDEGERRVKVIAERLGITEYSVRRYLRDNGRKLGKKTRNFVHSDKTLEIAQALQDGEFTQYKIAQNFGVSRQYVNKVKRKLELGKLDYEQP